MQLRGPKDSQARLRVRDGAGTERDVTIVRSQPHASETWLPAFRKGPETYGVLPSGFGYIDLERLSYAEPSAEEAKERAPKSRRQIVVKAVVQTAQASPGISYRERTVSSGKFSP
jgi:hypothetical protein